MNLIKIFNSSDAKKLESAGFNYMLENVNGETVYVFSIPDEFLNELGGKFNASSFAFGNTLTF